MKSKFLLLLILSTSHIVFGQFVQAPLPYNYTALEPWIDAQTMEIHYSKHHAAYVNNLNQALKGTDAVNWSMDKLLASISTQPDVVRNNAGGHFNHELFWSVLSPENSEPSRRLMKAIMESFENMDAMKAQMNEAASKRFGSGWAWLIVTPEKGLAITSTANQDNPLMDIATTKGIPILGIDVWEHAYYLKYQNKRGDYLAAIWNVINWKEVSKRYEAAVPINPLSLWPEIKEFHGVMSSTFHPAEEGDMEPIKTRSREMVDKAVKLSLSAYPDDFNTAEVKAAITQLVADSKSLDKMVRSKKSDAEILQSLSNLHDLFHKIIRLCRA